MTCPRQYLACHPQHLETHKHTHHQTQACELLIQVYQIIPGLPRIKMEEVKALRGMGLMDIVFDNIISDFIVRQKIKKAQRCAAEMYVLLNPNRHRAQASVVKMTQAPFRMYTEIRLLGPCNAHMP